MQTWNTSNHSPKVTKKKKPIHDNNWKRKTRPGPKKNRIKKKKKIFIKVLINQRCLLQMNNHHILCVQGGIYTPIGISYNQLAVLRVFSYKF